MFANYTTGFCVSAHRLWYLVSSYTRQDRTLLAALPLSLITRRTRLLVRDPLAHISKHLYTCTWEATADTHTHIVAQSRQSVCGCGCVTDDTCKLTQTHSVRTRCACDGPVTSSISVTHLNVFLFSLKQDRIERGCL